MPKMDIDLLEKRLAVAARRFVSPEEADYFASFYMETHLKKSPRMNPLAEAAADLTVWDKQAAHEVTLLIEVLTGTLVRRLLSTDQTPGWHPHEYGCLVLAPDIAGFTDKDAFNNAVSDMCRNLRNATPADGVERVAIPGDRGHEKLKMARKDRKIDIDDTWIDALNRLNPQVS